MFFSSSILSSFIVLSLILPPSFLYITSPVVDSLLLSIRHTTFLPLILYYSAYRPSSFIVTYIFLSVLHTTISSSLIIPYSLYEAKCSFSLSNSLLLFNRHKTCSLITFYSLFFTPWPLFVIKSSVGTVQQLYCVFHRYQFPLIMASADRNPQLYVTKEQETIKVLGSSVNHIACHSSARTVIISHENMSSSLVYISKAYSSYQRLHRKRENIAI